MCVVSMVGDHYKTVLPNNWPGIQYPAYQPPAVSTYEFAALKKEVEDIKALLLKAKKYDEDNGEKDCEMADKVEFLEKVAAFVGVDLKEVFGK